MKATIISVFKSKDYMIKYCYHNVPKNKDDVGDTSFGTFYPPMMVIRLWKEDLELCSEGRLEVNTQVVFASPQVIKEYTGFDLFDTRGFWSFSGRVLDIEFKWGEREYPYLRTYSYKDHTSTEKFRIPEINKIEEIKYDW